jgi:ATP-dependent DNA helicase DinG
MVPTAQPAPSLRVPEAPVLVAGFKHAKWIDISGAIEDLSRAEAARRARSGPPPVVCHVKATARRLGIDPFPALDLLELFAFVRPAAFCPPTPRGLAAALGLPVPGGLEGEAWALRSATERLIAELAEPDLVRDPDTAPIARAMAAGGWLWGEVVLAALPGGVPGGPERETPAHPFRGLEVWRRLKEWQEFAPEPPPGQAAVTADESRARLVELLKPRAEERPQQRDYAGSVTAAFTPRETDEGPIVVLAEAGTGVGKTLGYLAPASVWAQKNHGPVWVSTYTRNLQHQIDGELDRLYREPGRKAAKAVIRKGRENYLCLLNLEEAVGALPARRPGGGEKDVVALGLIARWAARSRDGDMIGGDFPAWLADLLGPERTLALTDRRGECIYSACPRFRTCFIERGIRRSRRAEIVIANHALVMVQAALGGLDDAYLPTRYVFDEGHHVFDAADGAFSSHLTGLEMLELRRWLLGAEARGARASASRLRGLRRRIGDIADDDGEASSALAAALAAAAALVSAGWLQRLGQGTPRGPAEAFLALVRQQAYARAPEPGNPYSLEAASQPPVAGLVEAAELLEADLAGLAAPLAALARRLAELLDERAARLDTPERLRIEAMCRGIARRASVQIEAWRAMLRALAGETPPDFVDWFAVARRDGRDADIGMHRHWIDPTLPFAEQVMDRAQGVLVTSATLRDGSGDQEADWAAAEARTGAGHVAGPPARVGVPSPFDYPASTRVLVVTDVDRDDPDQVAAAYRELFLAANGGGLGLFTAIARLRAVHARLAAPLEEAGLPLFAQHVDGLDITTLIEIFRAEPDACLLGTDAVRDGVDVPGRALRLIVFDRVPWPRPDIPHRARKRAFGGPQAGLRAAGAARRRPRRLRAVGPAHALKAFRRLPGRGQAAPHRPLRRRGRDPRLP